MDKDNSVTIHERNLQALATEVYKSINGLSSVIMRGVFDTKNTPYNFRSSSILCTRNVKTVKYGSASLSFRGLKIWALVSDSIKVSNLSPKLENGSLLAATVKYVRNMYLICFFYNDTFALFIIHCLMHFSVFIFCLPICQFLVCLYTQS